MYEMLQAIAMFAVSALLSFALMPLWVICAPAFIMWQIASRNQPEPLDSALV